MKKVLILTETAGNGHNACARDIKAKLEEIGGVEVKVVDILKEYSTAWNVWVVDKGYSLAVSKLLPIYDMFYNHYLRLKPETRYKNMAQGTVNSTLNGLLKEILDFKPDVIFCTHYNAGIALTNLRLVYDIPCMVVEVNLDYVNSPFWESTIGVDYFVIPDEDFIEESIAEGFSREQLLPLGHPVSEKTLKSYDKKIARQELGLDPNTFTIMVMFGGGYWSGGFKIFKDVIKIVEGRKVQIIMINGRNQKSFNKISKMKFAEGTTVLNLGFTDKIPLCQSACDIIVNKFGGACSVEMLNAGLPMLITEKIPAQEKYSLEYVKKKGAALSFKNFKELKENLLNMMDDETLRKSMSEKTVPFRKNATQGIADLIIGAPKADYTKLIEENIDFTQVKRKVKKALRTANKEEKTKAKRERRTK